MKKLIHVKKHLRKGKVVKSHTRKASKELKKEYLKTLGKGKVSAGRLAQMRYLTDPEIEEKALIKRLT